MERIEAMSVEDDYNLMGGEVCPAQIHSPMGNFLELVAKTEFCTE
jgi:hypothetical protein